MPVVFIGSCTLSGPTVWQLQERAMIRPVTEKDTDYFPVLAQDTEGKYVVARLGEIPPETKLVSTVAKTDEEKINLDLRSSIGVTSDYRYFQVLSEERGITQILLEVPTTHDSRTKGWYSLKDDHLTPQKMVSYGPGFAMLIIPWTIGAGFAGVLLFCLVFRRGRKIG